MKKIFLFLFLTAILFVACSPETPPQPKTNYDIGVTTAVPTAVKYHFFLEKKSATAYKLVAGMDYKAPDVSSLEVGASTNLFITTSLNNDGSEYAVGVVAENAAGFYGALGVAVGIVNVVPAQAGGVYFRKH